MSGSAVGVGWGATKKYGKGGKTVTLKSLATPQAIETIAAKRGMPPSAGPSLWFKAMAICPPAVAVIWQGVVVMVGKKMGKKAVHVRFFSYFCDINSIPHTIDAGIGYLSGTDKSNKGRKR